MNLNHFFKPKFLPASQDESDGKRKKLGSLSKKNKYNLYAYTQGLLYSPGG